MGRGKPNKKVVERPKTRKELRKDKRLQKKQNRVHFQKRKKELKIEYKERLKQQKKNKQQPKKRLASQDDDEEYMYDQADMSDNDADPERPEDYENASEGHDDSDEEIESDFTLSDDELEEKFKGRTTTKQPKAIKAKKPELDRFQQDLQKEKQKQRRLEKEMKKQRVKQLIAANDEEDKVIRKLEKQLKIDKKRSEKHVPTMFNDGLEYALELCLPENIQKMYTAAKEAAEQDEDSDTGFQEDLDVATGNNSNTTKNTKKRKRDGEDEDAQQHISGKKSKVVGKTAQKMAKLRQAESKYFDDDVESDLGSSNDSENEIIGSDDEGPMEVHKKNKKKSTMHTEIDEDDFGLQDDENDFVDDESDESEDGEDYGDEDSSLSEDDSDESSEDVQTNKKTKETTRNGKKKKVVERTLQDLSSDDSVDEDDFSDDDDEPPHNKKLPKKSNEIKPPKKNERTLADLSEDDELDEEDFDQFGDSDYSDDDSHSNSKKNYNTKGDVWEDIYGRTRDKDGNIIKVTSRDETNTTADSSTDASAKYVPPHLRAKLQAANSDELDPKRREKLLRLKKQLKGYVNRLSEANVHRIATDIESVYMQNSRHDVNDTLTKLIEDALVSNVLAPERLVLEHMLLIAALHANVGSEVGAHFLQKIVEKFDSMFGKIDEYDVEDKRLDNVLFMLCHMYTFKLFQHNLIYEILAKFTANLSEKSVECILLALRSIGFALRKDDAIALKDLIATLQRKSNEASDAFKNNSRLKYMLDVLLAIKNNNVNKIPSYDPALAEHLRKILRGMLVNGKYVTTLNITLEDLLRADQRGKWWVVGSAWTGNVSDIGAASAAAGTANSSKSSSAAYAEATKFSATILALAKKQRMNTDDRKNVFCILMTSEDYLDAFEKLHHLGIRDHKVIVTVIIHCCLSEKLFNPYYAVLTQKFCDFDRKYQLAVQFALWDRIKDLNNHTAIQVKNMAQYLIYLIQNGGLALSVLKVIEFGELDKVTLRLVRQVVLGLLMGPETVCKQVFERIAPGAKLKSFKDSLRLFLHHFLLKGGTKSGIDDDQMTMLRNRIRLADKSLESVDSRLEF